MSNSKYSSSPQKSCHAVLQSLRSSSLIFYIQESPYSAYITIRKRFRKDVQSNRSLDGPEDAQLEVSNRDLENIKISYDKIKKDKLVINNPIIIQVLASPPMV